MKNWLFLAPLVLPVAWLACASDDAASGGSPASDAGPSATTTPTTSPTATAEAGAADTGAPVLQNLVSGEYAIAYVDNTTIDARPKAEAVFDANGGLTSYKSSEDERPEIGAATNDGVKSDGVIAVGRWIGGPTAGKFYADPPRTYDAVSDGFHWALGKLAPADATPKASVVYELDFADPVSNAGITAPGTVTEFTLTFTAAEDGGAPTGTVSVASSIKATTSGTAQLFTGGLAPQVRGNGAVVFAGLFVGPTADRMIVAIANPFHAAVALKKK